MIFNSFYDVKLDDIHPPPNQPPPPVNSGPGSANYYRSVIRTQVAKSLRSLSSYQNKSKVIVTRVWGHIKSFS